MATLPTPLRAALGLAAAAIDEARKLPETLPQLPVAAISTAMQASLRVQQHIAEYAARGDELLMQLRGTSEEPPAWATFDDQPSAAAGSADATVKAAFELIDEADAIIEDELVPIDPEPSLEAAEPRADEPSADEPSAASPGPQSSESSGPAAAGPAGPPPAKKAPAKKAAPAKAVPAKAAPAKAAAAKAAPAKAAPAKKAAAKKAPAKAEPLEVAAERAEPTDPPNPSVMAAEIVQAHQAETE